MARTSARGLSLRLACMQGLCVIRRVIDHLTEKVEGRLTDVSHLNDRSGREHAFSRKRSERQLFAEADAQHRRFRGNVRPLLPLLRRPVIRAATRKTSALGQKKSLNRDKIGISLLPVIPANAQLQCSSNRHPNQIWHLCKCDPLVVLPDGNDHPDYRYPDQEYVCRCKQEAA